MTARIAARRRSTRALRAGPASWATSVVVVFGYAPPGVWGGEIADHEEAIEELGEKVIGEAREQAEAARSPRSTSRWSPKRATEALIEVADERDARMIVVGSQGETPLKGIDPRLDHQQAAPSSHDGRCWSCRPSDVAGLSEIDRVFGDGAARSEGENSRASSCAA